MRYYLYGPMELPRGDDNLLNFDEYDRVSMWADFEVETELGMPDACGCYVFAMRTGRATIPWYVGKAEKQSFKNECLTADKINKYNAVLGTSGKGTPLLYFYGRATSQRRNWSAPTKSKHRDIVFLERLLIGAALKRNKNLLNVRETGLLKQMIVPGFINNPPGKAAAAVLELKSIMGY